MNLGIIGIGIVLILLIPSITAMAQVETRDLLISLLEPSTLLPQAERQRINDLVVSCTEAAAENSYYGKFTTVTDEGILAIHPPTSSLE
jgi:Na+-transporting methylmalonyl-CoA/oxaloacetate decarboxylase gamma subunit